MQGRGGGGGKRPAASKADQKHDNNNTNHRSSEAKPPYPILCFQDRKETVTAMANRDGVERAFAFCSASNRSSKSQNKNQKKIEVSTNKKETKVLKSFCLCLSLLMQTTTKKETRSNTAYIVQP